MISIIGLEPIWKVRIFPYFSVSSLNSEIKVTPGFHNIYMLPITGSGKGPGGMLRNLGSEIMYQTNRAVATKTKMVVQFSEKRYSMVSEEKKQKGRAVCNISYVSCFFVCLFVFCCVFFFCFVFVFLFVFFFVFFCFFFGGGGGGGGGEGDITIKSKACGRQLIYWRFAAQ